VSPLGLPVLGVMHSDTTAMLEPAAVPLIVICSSNRRSPPRASSSLNSWNARSLPAASSWYLGPYVEPSGAAAASLSNAT